MSYTLIASEDILMKNASSAGSSETRTFQILERFAEDPEEVTEIGIKGDPLLVAGNRGNDMFYFMMPVQIQFSIKDKYDLLSRMTNRAKKDFKLQVMDDETVEYELYLYLPSSDKEYFESNPQLDLVATNAMGLLKDEYFNGEDAYIELDAFIEECFTRLGLGGNIEFFSQWESSDNASRFPIGYRVKKSFMIRHDETGGRLSYWDVLKVFCEQFNLQIKQQERTWVIVERKRQLTAPVSVSGIRFGASIVEPALITQSFRTALTSDQVTLKPKGRFKPGPKEIYTRFKMNGDLFVDPDFSSVKPFNTSSYWISSGWEHSGIYYANNLNQQIYPGNADSIFQTTYGLEGGVVKDGWVKQRSEYAINDEDRIQLDFSFRIDINNEDGDVEYMRLWFYGEDGTIKAWDYAAAAWKDYDDVTLTNFTEETIDYQNAVTVSDSLTITPPEGKQGYVEIYIKSTAAVAIRPVKVYVDEFSIELKLSFERQDAIYVNSRGVRNPQRVTLVFGQGDADEYSERFCYEYYDSNDEWIIADFIDNAGNSASIFEVAPYDRMCQCNRDQIEYPLFKTRKYLLPDWTKTIALALSETETLYAIPLEYKWNMVTGEVECFSAEAFEDPTGITKLKYYNPEDYEAVDPLTVVADDGQLLEGFTKGAEAGSGYGFVLDYDGGANSVTESSKFIEIDGLHYEIETLILN